MSVPCDYPFSACFLRALILLYKPGPHPTLPSNWSGTCNASAVSVKQAKKVKTYQWREESESERTESGVISQHFSSLSPTDAGGEIHMIHIQSLPRHKQCIFTRFLTTKLHTGCNKAVKQPANASLGTLAYKDQGGFHNNSLNPPQSTWLTQQ